jgi:rod shape-determining protein MreD
VRSPRTKAFWLFIAALAVQLVLLKHIPAFGKTFDLLLLFIVALAVSQEMLLALIYAAVAGIIIDSLSIAHAPMHTAYYLAVAAFLSTRRPYIFLNNTFPFVVTLALAALGEVAFNYVWTFFFIMTISPVLLMQISWLGFIFLVALGWLAGRRLLLMLKDPEVLDFEVRR